METELPAQLLRSVPHVTFSVFTLAIPNIVAWGAVVVLFSVLAWVRLPRWFEPKDKENGGPQ